MRYVVLALLILTGFLSFRRYDPHKPLMTWRVFYLFRLLVVLAFTGLLANVSWKLLEGRSTSEELVSMEFPLKNGQYYISSGGTNATINNHRRIVPSSQQFAIDINKLGPMGSASRNVLSGLNDHHHIYGELVYSPCTGKVIRVVNDVIDNEHSTMNVSAEDGQGNLVDIRCQGFLVSLVHLQEGSVVVEQGEEVTAGQVIGKVGNSGFSQEPHLHFQVAEYSADSSLIGVPMSIDDRFLVRNDIVRSQ